MSYSIERCNKRKWQCWTKLLPAPALVNSVTSVDDESEFAPSKPRKKQIKLSVGFTNPEYYQKRLCYLQKCCCTCHDPISDQSRQSWSQKIPLMSSFLSPWNRSSCVISKSTSIWISLSQLGVPWAIYINMDFMWSSQQFYMSPLLRVQRVVKRTSPGFKLLW